MGQHTIEKIGGTSMSRFGEVMENVIIGKRKGAELYNRVFVVSAYSSITNLLLEDKKTGAPGVFGQIAAGNSCWTDALETVREKMLEYNKSFTDIGLDLEKADAFVNERINGIRSCLEHLMFLRTAGHLKPSEYLPSTREFLAAIGEAHSAYNSTLILQKRGINARFVDLSGWMSTDILTFDEAILSAFKGIDFATEMPIVTGYVKYDEGITLTLIRPFFSIFFDSLREHTPVSFKNLSKRIKIITSRPFHFNILIDNK